MSLSVVLASRIDKRAADLVAQAREVGLDCELLTPNDMTAPGWTLHPGACAASTFVVSGRRRTMSAIRTVYVRLPCVTPYELVHVRPEEREYAAAEVHAFALAWLSELGHRVLNRASPFLLAGHPVDLAAWQPEAVRSPADFTGRVRLSGEEVSGTAGFDQFEEQIRMIGRDIGCRYFALEVGRGQVTAVDYWFDDDLVGAHDLMGLLR